MPLEAAVRYNEKDAHAAQWLRNLIALGELPEGQVDERSIVDVRGDELAGYDECHFFAGIGVWARAVAEAEDAAGRFARPLWTGSCPCQPLSVAGKQQGHVDERHLWPHFHRLIAECRPATVFGEQVAGQDGREWMAAVRHDLEAAGYAVGCAVLPAGGFGAPHIRYRLFFVAHAAMRGRQQFADARSAGLFGSTAEAREQMQQFGADGAGLGELADAQERGRDCGTGLRNSGSTSESRIVVADDGGNGGLADADGLDRQEVSEGDDALDQQRAQIGRGQLQPAGTGANGGTGGGNYHSGRGSVWPAKNMAGMARSSPLDGFWRDPDWIFCRDGKWRPIEPGSQPLVDGAAFRLGSGGAYEGMSRAGMLRGYGNALVLPVARAFVECAMEALHAH